MKRLPTEMELRIARTLYDNLHRQSDQPGEWGAEHPETHKSYLDDARAAIGAMRFVTEDMNAAGIAEMLIAHMTKPIKSGGGSFIEISPTAARDVWVRMISAASPPEEK